MSQTRIQKSEALAAYDGNGAALARALGVSRQYVNKLPEGPVPELWDYKLRFVLRPDLFPAASPVSGEAA
ncbi:hypothetical protein ACQQ2N_12255 [Dokdonella sp. MW10]|uniref:hypothetical protein n=1 Tax=Dokdonella sp. MW10 TaxID=2992926 RepID=UPI003F7D39CE